MTIKDISEKYKVPYNLAWEATMGVQPFASIWRDKDFPEKEVVKNIKALLKQRIDTRQKYVEEAERMLTFIRWREVQ